MTPCYRCDLRLPSPFHANTANGESQLDRFVVLLSVSNFQDASGGIWDAPILMSQSDMDAAG